MSNINDNKILNIFRKCPQSLQHLYMHASEFLKEKINKNSKFWKEVDIYLTKVTIFQIKMLSKFCSIKRNVQKYLKIRYFVKLY